MLLKGGTFDNTASCDGSPVLVRSVSLRGDVVGTCGWGVRVAFKCMLLGPEGPGFHAVEVLFSCMWEGCFRVWGVCLRVCRQGRVVLVVGTDRTLRTTQWTRASMTPRLFGVVL